MDNQLSISWILDDSRCLYTQSEDEQNLRYLLQNAKLLGKLDLSVLSDRDLVDLPPPTLKVLNLTVSLYSDSYPLPLARLCNELEAMAGHNILEALSLKVHLEGHETGFYRIYIPKSGEGTGQTWVVFVKTCFL